MDASEIPASMASTIVSGTPSWVDILRASCVHSNISSLFRERFGSFERNVSTACCASASTAGARSSAGTSDAFLTSLTMLMTSSDLRFGGDCIADLAISARPTACSIASFTRTRAFETFISDPSITMIPSRASSGHIFVPDFHCNACNLSPFRPITAARCPPQSTSAVITFSTGGVGTNGSGRDVEGAVAALSTSRSSLRVSSVLRFFSTRTSFGVSPSSSLARPLFPVVSLTTSPVFFFATTAIPRLAAYFLYPGRASSGGHRERSHTGVARHELQPKMPQRHLAHPRALTSTSTSSAARSAPIGDFGMCPSIVCARGRARRRVWRSMNFSLM